jgi:nucleoside phosphorylase
MVALVIPLLEEFVSVTTVLENRRTESGIYEDTYILREPDSGRELRATVLPEMGQTTAAMLVQRLIEHWTPPVIVVLGIAGALDSALQLGDVVVATQIDAYSANLKARPGETGDDWELAHAGRVYPAPTSLLRPLHELYLSQERRPALERWVADVNALRPELDLGGPEAMRWGTRDPKIHLGHLASGDILAGSSRYGDWLKQRDRKLLAVEMEAGGAAQAAHEREVPLLVIRGVSDFADERKSALDKGKGWPPGAWRDFAARSAAHLLALLLRDDAWPARGQPALLPASPELDVAREHRLMKDWQDAAKPVTARVEAGLKLFNMGSPRYAAGLKDRVISEAQKPSADVAALHRYLEQLFALTAKHSDLAPLILDLVASDSHETRRTAIFHIGELGLELRLRGDLVSPAMVEAVVLAATDSVPCVRREVSHTLGKLPVSGEQRPEVLESLIALANDDCQVVREAAVQSQRDLGVA